jgi:hypothetical protein
LIVATSFPLPSGLARFTSCELPNDAALFSPDISVLESSVVPRGAVSTLVLLANLFSRVRSFGFVSFLVVEDGARARSWYVGF